MTSAEEIPNSAALVLAEPTQRGILSSPLADLEHAADLAGKALAESTRRAYASDVKIFLTYCDSARLAPTTVAAVAAFLAAEDKAGRAVATIRRRHIALRQWFRDQGISEPVPTEDLNVKKLLHGLRRERGSAQRQALPIFVEHLAKWCAVQPDTLHAVLHQALLLLGWAGGFRRSELVALTVGDLAFDDLGAVVTIRRGKTDQEGRGRAVRIPPGDHPLTCPVTALKNWLERSKVSTGPVFRRTRRGRVWAKRGLCARTVDDLVKRLAASVGLDATKYSAHSLRAGFITTCAMKGKPDSLVMKTTGHKSAAMLCRYQRDAELRGECAGSGIGL